MYQNLKIKKERSKMITGVVLTGALVGMAGSMVVLAAKKQKEANKDKKENK